MEKVRVLGLVLNDRMEEAEELQGILTKYGCNIRTRLGLHEVREEKCARDGLIILELVGEKSDWMKMEEELLNLDSVEFKRMDFEL